MLLVRKLENYPLMRMAKREGCWAKIRGVATLRAAIQNGKVSANAGLTTVKNP